MGRRPTTSGGTRRITINLEGLGEETPPKTQLIATSEDGEELFSAEVGKDGQVDLPAAALEKAARVRLQPADAEDDEAARETALSLRARDFAGALDTGRLDVATGIWRPWLTLMRCVSGSVRVCRRSPWWFRDLETLAARPVALGARDGLAVTAARLSPAASIDALIAWPTRCHPVCQGRVEVWRRVCCCEPWIICDPRLPELEAELEGLIPIPLPDPRPDPIPDPFPGPIPIPGPGPGPRPGPLPRALSRDADAVGDTAVLRSGTLDLRAARAAQDLHALRTLPQEAIADYVNARPYLLCLRTSCSAPVKVAEGTLGPDGKFNICWRAFPQLLRAGCHEEFAYVVRQSFGPLWLKIFDGVAAGDWHSASDTPTLTTYHPWAYGCRNNPHGAFVFLDIIGDTGAHELITPDSDSAVSVQTPAYNSGLVFPAPSPAAAMGASLNRNWGGTLKLNYMFTEGMQAVGAKYYRITVVEADANGDPTGTRHRYDEGLSWLKTVPDGGGGVDIVPVSLGPVSVGGQDALYTIPYDTNPTTDWNAGQYHAYLNTNDPRWSDPSVRHLVMVEVFDDAGQRLRPTGTPATGLGGAEVEADFGYRRRYQETGATAAVPFGALSHMFWWDNRDVFGDIVDLRRNGLVFNAECLFFGGTEDTTFSVGYRAYHPNQQFQLYHRLWWRRGLGNTMNSSGTLQGNTALNVGVPPAGAGGSATETFGNMLLPNAPDVMDPPRNRCAFTVFLNVWGKRTDGDDLGHPHMGDTAAFVLEIDG